MADSKNDAPISLNKRDYPEIYGENGRFVKYAEPKKPEPPKIVARNGNFVMGEDGELYPVHKNPYALAEPKKNSVAYQSMRYETAKALPAQAAPKAPPAPTAAVSPFSLRRGEKVIWKGRNMRPYSGKDRETKAVKIIGALMLLFNFMGAVTGTLFVPLIISFSIGLPYLALLAIVLKQKYGHGSAEYTVTDQRIIYKNGKDIKKRDLDVLTGVKLSPCGKGRADVLFYTGKNYPCGLMFTDMKLSDARFVCGIIQSYIDIKQRRK